LSFLHTEFLYFMLPPLFVLFALLLTQKESHSHFFTKEVMDKLRVGSAGLNMRARNVLFLFVGFFMIVALAKPVINDGVIKVQAKSADIMIAFDISDSMLAKDVYPNRLELAKQKAIELLKLAPNERIGVVAFAKNSYLVSPMSFDHGAVNFLLHQLDTTNITEKGTNFLSMLEVVDRSIKNDKKYLLIISDGGDKDSFKDEIAFAKEKHITVFVLGVGTKQGSPIKKKDGSFVKYRDKIIISKLNDKISELATATGGVYIQNVKSDKDIKTMLKEIESKSKKKELKSEDVHRYIALFYYPLGLALFLLLIATSSFSRASRGGTMLVVGLLMFVTPHAKAGMLDFMKLDEAKKAYELGEYEKSAKLYDEYAKSSGNAQAYYNAGNAFYKLKQYKKAIKSYKKATFKDKGFEARNLANIGNAYAKQLKQKELKQAIKSYEKSLKLKEDKDVRENLQEVKKLLKKQQQKSKKKKKKDNKSDKNKNNKKDNKDKKSDKKSKGDKSKKSNKSDKKDNKNKKNNQSKKHDENSKKLQGDKKKKEDLKKLDKGQQKKQMTFSKEKMSDKEEAKWLKQLNLQKNTYLYRLNNQKPKEENDDEKPW